MTESAVNWLTQHLTHSWHLRFQNLNIDSIDQLKRDYDNVSAYFTKAYISSKPTENPIPDIVFMETHYSATKQTLN